MSATRKLDSLEAAWAAYIGFFRDAPGQAFQPDRGCLYWDQETGRNCVIGSLIPVEHLERINALDPGGVIELICEFPALDGIVRYRDGDGPDLARAVQAIHDNPDAWKDESAGHGGLSLNGWDQLRETGRRFGLCVDCETLFPCLHFSGILPDDVELPVRPGPGQGSLPV